MIKKHNISFRLDNRNDLHGEVLILLVLTFLGLRVILSTGVRIAPQSWDAEAQRPVRGAVNAARQDAREISYVITQRSNDLEGIFRRLSMGDVIPAPEEIRAEFHKLVNPPKNKLSASLGTPTTIQGWLSIFVQEMSAIREWTSATKEKMHALAGHLRAVNPNMTFEDLDHNGLAKIVEHFRSMTMQDGTIGMKNSTIKKQMEYLSWFLSWASKKGVNTNLAYQSFHPALKHTKNKIIYLTDQELDRLATVDLTEPNRRHLARIRDIFIFQCYSGLRYSDVENLRWSDIRDNTMTITTVKTMDTITIDLNSHTRELLDKYRQFQFPDNKVFPAPTNQEANRHLKELCRLAAIDEPITMVYYKGKERIDEVKAKYELIGTHAGRRTFVVKALSLGISPYIIMKWTGHASMNSMKPYMDLVDSAKAEAMKKFN